LTQFNVIPLKYQICSSLRLHTTACRMVRKGNLTLLTCQIAWSRSIGLGFIFSF